jgi:hypothetical protein
VNALQRLTLALASTVAVAAIAAEQPATRSISASSLVESHRTFVAMQVEYCLRNEPDLLEVLVLSHATYLQASEGAALRLVEKYPTATSSQRIVLATGTDARAKSAQLRMIQARGFSQCPELVAYMHNATADSLTSSYQRDYVNLLNAIQRAP